jgi:hypothetical protein
MPRGAAEVTIMTACRTTMVHSSLIRGGIAAWALWLGVGAASAQEAPTLADARPGHAITLPRLLDSVELVRMPSTGFARGPRALRIRFEGTTEAVRSLGVDATDCATYLRSTSGARRTLGTGLPGGEIRGRPGLWLALNCSF